MKYLVASDLHGSFYYAKEFQRIVKQEKPDLTILLGDLYYHGPRNPLPKDYRPREVCDLLNGMKNELLVVKGNCDAEVDEMISEFPFAPFLYFSHQGKQIFASHGQKYNPTHLPEATFDILLYGHTHIGEVFRQNGKLFANPGSLSLPKNGTPHSYLILDDALVLKDLAGNLLAEEPI